MRVRFAPSPTGQPHVGNMRTALYDWLLARSTGGVFVLRIEDTDVGRRAEGSVRQIMEALRWLGLGWDEGPDVGGPYGPYVQSERLDLYTRFAEALLECGAAYRCFCSPETLEAQRKQQVAARRPPRYAGTCRRLPPETATARKGEPHVIRLRVPLSGDTAVCDALRGEMHFANGNLDDPVLLKSDGFPTYHLANVVDDHLMRITHVLRGEEWIPSLPWHIMIYRALGWEPPVFVHLPLLVDKEHAKIKKRAGGTSVEEYRKLGYLPDALVNYIALLGWHPGTKREVMTRQELVAGFSLDRLSRSPAVFDIERLSWFGKQHIRALPEDKLEEAVKPYLTHAFGAWHRAIGTELAPDRWLRSLLEAVKGEMSCLSDIVPQARFAFVEKVEASPEALAALAEPPARNVLEGFMARVRAVERLDYESADALYRELRADLKVNAGLSGKQVMQPIRAALTGSLAGPCLVVVTILLGRQKCIERVSSFVR